MTVPIEIFYCIGGFATLMFIFGLVEESKISQVERIFIHILTFLAFLFVTGFLLMGIENDQTVVFVAPYLAYSVLIILIWEFLSIVYKTFRLIKYVIRPETMIEGD